MIRLSWAPLAILALLVPGASAAPVSADNPLERLPLRFEPTAEPGFAFASMGNDFTALLGPGAIELRFHEARGISMVGNRGRRPSERDILDQATLRSENVVRMQLVGGNAAAEIKGEAPLPGRSSYYLGSDSEKWRIDVPHYARVRYAAAYPGVDLVLYGNKRQLEYDFVVAPGADPERIELALGGAATLQINAAGDLAWNTASGRVQQHRPLIYQDVEGRRVHVPGGYVLRGPDRVGFEITGPYDRQRPLVIDPVLTYSSFVHGVAAAPEIGHAVGLDAAGNVYVAGRIGSSFPPIDIFVAKVNPMGTALLYWVVIGGSGIEFAADIAVRPDGRVYATGSTTSTNLPLMPLANPFQGQNNGGGVNGVDAFLIGVDPTGSLVYSTYFGGTGVDAIGGVAVDGNGDVYLMGDSNSTNQFPGDPSGSAGYYDIFLSRLRLSGSPITTTIIYSRFFGSAADEVGSGSGLGFHGLALDAQNNAYITGFTYASPTDGFPVLNAAQASPYGDAEGFVAKFDGAGTIVYSSFLGGTEDDFPGAMAVDAAGAAYVTGYTGSPDFPAAPTWPPAPRAQPVLSGVEDGFVVKVSPSGSSFGYFTFMGGLGYEDVIGVAVDDDGSAHVSGWTTSLDLPVVNPLQPNNSESTNNYSHYEAMFGKIAANGGSFHYLTYFGGIGLDQGRGVTLDSAGVAYYTGWASQNFPLQNPFQSFGGVSSDAFLVKITDGTPPELEIQTTTTRWKPQRSDEPIIVKFTGPPDLSLLGTLEIQGPTGTITIDDLTITQDGPNFSISWVGPWVYMDGGVEKRLPARHYPLRVLGTAGSLPTQRAVRSPIYEKVSFVEVATVELTRDVGQGPPLDSNPAVGVATGQDLALARPSEGKRVFAEAATYTGAAEDTVTVVATIFPSIPVDPDFPPERTKVRVHFKSFDVDDAGPSPPDLDNDAPGDAPTDNRGIALPREGSFPGCTGCYVDVEAGQDTARTVFQVVGQPGNNYRVAASTSLDWFAGPPELKAIQPSYTGEMNKTGPISEMLTVWRTIHLEVDSMGAPPPPTEPPPDPPDIERNIIRGRVMRIWCLSEFECPARLTLEPELPDASYRIDDGSPNFSSTGSPVAYGEGRFEHGTVRIGTEAEPVVIANLEGNGEDYVQRIPGIINGPIQIPVQLTSIGGAIQNSTLQQWDADAQRLVLADIVIVKYVSGTLELGGITWTIASVNGREVFVQEDQDLPFLLFDDDTALHPFEADTSLLRPLAPEEPGVLGLAYIRVVLNTGNARTAPFNRNVHCVSSNPDVPNCPDFELENQLGAGRDNPTEISTAGYWAAYHQMGFQGDATADVDPLIEAGAAINGISMTDEFGSMSFVELLWEQVEAQYGWRDPSQFERCRRNNLAHEVGHQLGLPDLPAEGLMQNCLANAPFFSGRQLGIIRSKGAS